MPDRLAALLDRRLYAASTAERDVLVALAVTQRPLGQSLAAAMLGVPEQELTPAVRALVGRGLVQTVPGTGELRLRHALLADQVRAVLLAAEERDWHRRVAEALATSPGCAPAEVAAHWAAAAVPEQERRWSVLAAQAAEQVHAWAAAADLWGRADELSAYAPVSGHTAVYATLRRVVALVAAGQEYVAAAAAASALATGRFETDPPVWAELVLHRDFQVADLDVAVAELRRADLALAELGPSVLRAQVLRQLGRRLDDRGEHRAGAACFQQALEVAEAAGAGAFARLLRGSLTVRAHHEGAPIGTTLRTLAALVDEAREHAEGAVLMQLGMYLTDRLIWAGQPATAADRGQGVLDEAARLGVEQTWAAGMVLGNTLQALLLLGRSQEARQLLDARRTGVLPGAPCYPHRANDAAVLITEGHLAQARALLDAMLPEIILGSDRELTWTTLTLDAGFWAGDEPARLVQLGTAALDRLAARMTDEDVAQLRWLVARLTTEGFAATDDLALSRERGAGEGRPIPAAYDRLARAKQSGDPDAWLDAAAAWSELGCRHLEGYARWRCAEQLVQQRRRHDAQLQLTSSVALSAGHEPQLERITALARHARLSIDQPTPTRSGEAPATPFGLTDRELQILALLTQGRSNNEIGAALFISGKTASVHVSNILRKLRVTSRVQAAALAEREHLV